jgi:hypothetical protein
MYCYISGRIIDNFELKVKDEQPNSGYSRAWRAPTGEERMDGLHLGKVEGVVIRGRGPLLRGVGIVARMARSYGGWGILFLQAYILR